MTLPAHRFAGLLLITALALSTIVSFSGAGAAHAAAKDLRVVQAYDGARLEVCRLPIQGGAKIRFYGRLDNSRGEEAHRGAMQVIKNGRPVGHEYNSGFVKAGKVSKTGSIVVKKGGQLSLTVMVQARQSGTGSDVSLGRVHRC